MPIIATTRNGTERIGSIAQTVTAPVLGRSPPRGSVNASRSIALMLAGSNSSVVAGVSPFSTSSDRRFVLNPAAFSVPAPGTFGNLGRGAVHGPGLTQFDLTLQKKFAITERVNTEFRVEMYNLLNRANFSNPVARLNNVLGTATNQLQPGQAYGTATGGAFGTVLQTVESAVGLGAQRQIQLSLRISF